MPGMRIAVGADHAGFRLKEHLKQTLTQLGHEITDFGTDSDKMVDYPAICAQIGRAVASGQVERGVIVGGSGQGEQIAANKIPGIRAALCLDLFTARMSRAHNDANILTLGGRIVAPPLADEIVQLWLSTPFEGGRHAERVQQIAQLERTVVPEKQGSVSSNP
jgi:ribose 5-phosphate isomerase B